MSAKASRKGIATAPTACRWSPHGNVAIAAVLGAILLAACGCNTSVSEYVQNGFKVGPNYRKPPAPVAKDWLDAADKRVRSESDDLSKWWTVFNDPVLDDLVCDAYKQNLTLRAAGMRILQARAQLSITAGNLFPQKQQAFGNYRYLQLGPNYFANFGGLGFNLNWEIDFWGRFRRAVEADAAMLDASVENYDDVLVTLLSDVATNYVLLRTNAERIRFARENVDLQAKTLNIVEARFKAGTVGQIDVTQARSTLEQTAATIPELEISMREAQNRLCILLGMPPADLQARLGKGPIPFAPPDVAVGVPVDLLRRRPDVRRAERQAAAQSARIGVAESEFLPHIAITGMVDFAAGDVQLKQLYPFSFVGASVGPSFHWNVLNYGRILNNVRLQDAKLQELVLIYQNTVLNANQDAENGLVTFLKAQERAKHQQASVDDAIKSANVGLNQYKMGGVVDFTRVSQLEQNLVQLQDTLAQAKGEIALGLIQVYKALGGGWQIRVQGCAAEARLDGPMPSPSPGLPAPFPPPPPQ